MEPEPGGAQEAIVGALITVIVAVCGLALAFEVPMLLILACAIGLIGASILAARADRAQR